MMTLCLVLLSTICANLVEVSKKHHRNHKKLSCAAVTAARISCGSNATCALRKARKIHKQCPDLAKAFRAAAKSAKNAKKLERKMKEKVAAMKAEHNTVPAATIKKVKATIRQHKALKSFKKIEKCF